MYIEKEIQRLMLFNKQKKKEVADLHLKKSRSWKDELLLVLPLESLLLTRQE